MLFGGTDFQMNLKYSVAWCLFRGWIKKSDIGTLDQLMQCGWGWNIWTTVMIILGKIAADFSSKNYNDAWYIIQETNKTFFNMSEDLFVGKGHKHRVPPATGYALEEFHWQRADDAGKCLKIRTFRKRKAHTMPRAELSKLYGSKLSFVCCLLANHGGIKIWCYLVFHFMSLARTKSSHVGERAPVEFRLTGHEQQIGQKVRSQKPFFSSGIRPLDGSGYATWSSS